MNNSQTVSILKSLQLNSDEQTLLSAGFCPKCEQPIRGKFQAIPDGMHFMAPEICETLREQGIDIGSGHKNNCELKGLRLP